MRLSESKMISIVALASCVAFGIQSEAADKPDCRQDGPALVAPPRGGEWCIGCGFENDKDVPKARVDILDAKGNIYQDFRGCPGYHPHSYKRVKLGGNEKLVFKGTNQPHVDTPEYIGSCYLGERENAHSWARIDGSGERIGPNFVFWVRSEADGSCKGQ